MKKKRETKDFKFSIVTAHAPRSALLHCEVFRRRESCCRCETSRPIFASRRNEAYIWRDSLGLSIYFVELYDGIPPQIY